MQDCCVWGNWSFKTWFYRCFESNMLYLSYVPWTAGARVQMLFRDDALKLDKQSQNIFQQVVCSSNLEICAYRKNCYWYLFDTVLLSRYWIPRHGCAVHRQVLNISKYFGQLRHYVYMGWSISGHAPSCEVYNFINFVVLCLIKTEELVFRSSMGPSQTAKMLGFFLYHWQFL